MKAFAESVIYVVYACLVASMVTFPPALADPAGKRMAVIGVKNSIKNDSYKSQWNRKLIAFGLCDLLAQEFYDTGLFKPVEDNPEIIREIDRLIGRSWVEKNVDYKPEEVDRIAGQLHCDAVAYGEIFKFEVSESRAFIGIFSRRRSKVTVGIRAYLKENGKPVQSFTGEGEAYTKSVGTLFRIREGKIYFDETAVGMAAKQAVEKAMAGFRRR